MMKALWLPALAILLAGVLATACSQIDDGSSGDPDTVDNRGDGNRPAPDGTNNGDDGTNPATDPGTTDPGTTDPGTTDPGTTDPGTTDPGTTDPGTTDPGTTDPGTTDPGTDVPSGTVAPGGLCDCDSDCETVDGHAGICVYGVCMTRASADCSAAGSTAECQAGARCWFLSDQPGPICWPDCDTYDCEGTCDGDGSCAPSESTDCDAACGSYCASGSSGGGDTGGTTGTIGAACLVDDDCGDALCMPEEDNGWINGYCFGWDCTTPGAACGNGGVCVAGLGTNGENVCMQTCDTGCREGYECMSYGEQVFCYPYCETVGDCPNGYQCAENVCIPGEPCSASAPDGYCDPDETCVDGTCEASCSPSTPTGVCPAGFECADGHCMSASGCGTWECTGTSCDTLVQMTGSYDPNSAQARADGYYIATNPNYAYLRGDLIQLIQWSACEMRARFPGIAPIAISDMSQADGMTPGTDVGSPRHPTSTHRGTDVDLAYYQTDGTNNPQIICGDGSDTNSNGYPGTYNDGYFCTTEQNIVDFEQETWFMALMAHHPDWRVVGVDETLDDDISAEADQLLSSGDIDATIRNRLRSLGVGADGGWQFHHHHTHFSFND